MLRFTSWPLVRNTKKKKRKQILKTGYLLFQMMVEEEICGS